MVIRTFISDLLRELNEKELEIPFRSLLRSHGYSTIFERTRHGLGEHGKDIVSLRGKEEVQTVHVFQLKTRDISTSRFRTEVKPELDAMIQVPIRHPMVKGTEPFTYTLVSTGDLSSDAAEEFDAYNKHNLRLGDPEIQLLNRSKLVELFYEDMVSLTIFTLSLQNSLARVWLDLKFKKYNRTDWFDFVTNVLNSNEQTERTLPFLGLATSFLASQARLQEEFFVAFDVFKIALVKTWAAICQLEKEKMAIFDQLHDEYCRLIEDFIKAVAVDSSRKEGLYHENSGVVESVLYPIRTFSVLGVLSYMAYFLGEKGDKKKENQLVELIETTIRNNPSALTPPADFLRKDIAITLAELCRNQRKLFAEKWIEALLENLYQRYIRSGWWPSESSSPEEIIENTFNFKKENRKEQPTSFLIPILFRFCAKLGAQKIYDRYSASFDDFRLFEFVPPDEVALAESELAQGILEHGTTIQKRFPPNFKDYCDQVSQITFKRYSPIEKNRPYILQMITDVHLHYVFPEIYLNFDDGE